MEKKAKIYVAGHTGLVGSALVRRLRTEGYGNILALDIKDLDLTDQAATDAMISSEKPGYVFIAAARVGGIHANNTWPAEFIYQNLIIAANLIHSSYRHGVKKLLFLGSSCIYPRMAPQPVNEDHLLTGPLEPTNEAYAIAKIAGLELCRFYRRQYGCDFISAMPTNLYGPGDNFDLETSHVLPALIRKFHEAAESGADSVTVWGTGKPKREFLFVEDLARALVFLMNNYAEEQWINVGTGEDISIADLATLVAKVTGFRGRIEYDASKPDGTPRKLLDVSKLHGLGWRHSVPLEEGIGMTYEWYRAHRATSGKN